jgi:hypothetical protein
LYGISLLVTLHGPHPGLSPTSSDDPESDAPTTKVRVAWKSDATSGRVTAAVAACFRCLKWVTSSMVVGVEPSKQNWLALCADLFLRCEVLLEELGDGLSALDDRNKYDTVRRQSAAFSQKRSIEAVNDPQEIDNTASKKQRDQGSGATAGDQILSHLELRFSKASVVLDGYYAGGKALFCIHAAAVNKGSHLTIFVNTQKSVPVFATVTRDQQPSFQAGSSSVFAGTFVSSHEYKRICSKINACLWKRNAQAREASGADAMEEEVVGLDRAILQTIEEAIAVYLSTPVV